MMTHIAGRAGAMAAVAFLAACGTLAGCRTNDNDTASSGARAPADLRGPDIVAVEGPFEHDRLAIYLLIADDATADPTRELGAYQTLAEALERGEAVVHETGDVGRLEIEVKGDRPVFVQSGDIVKGGRQDRTLATDAIITAEMGRVPIDAYCVEQGRWSQRGAESDAAFSVGSTRLADNELKRVGNLAFEEKSQGQRQVWDNVSRQVARLEDATAQRVAAPASPSSYQLAMESDAIAASTASFVEALSDLPQRHERVVGIAYAIDGKLVAADVYASPELLAQRYPALLRSAAVEAVAARSGAQPAAGGDPDSADAAAVLQWLKSVDDSELARAQDVNGRTRVTSTQKEKLAVYQCHDSRTGTLVHRGYLAE